jgi:hypothetical protein
LLLFLTNKEGNLTFLLFPLDKYLNSLTSHQWLVTDGYAAYRSQPKRQRCLAHLIRKAVAITGAINHKAAQIGQWILDDLRELITTIASGSEDNRLILNPIFKTHL